MYTNEQIKNLVKLLSQQQIKNILNEFYLQADNSQQVINLYLFKNSYRLDKELINQITIENIDVIKILLEINN
tara:strand:- start:1471 stop:1689 length:219 start_codon:yes stop_codon:yes gene_type:complete